MRYKSKPIFIEAVQWNKDGDHPDVVFVEEVDGSLYGEIALPDRWEIVNAGDYIINNEDGSPRIMTKEHFEETFEPILPELSDKNKLEVDLRCCGNCQHFDDCGYTTWSTEDFEGVCKDYVCDNLTHQQRLDKLRNESGFYSVEENRSMADSNIKGSDNFEGYAT